MKKVNVSVVSTQNFRKGSPVAAGLDIKAVTDPLIKGKRFGNTDMWYSIDYIEYDTGVKIAPEAGNHTLIMPRSSVSKYNLALANSVGLVDEDYRGNLILRFKYVFQPEDLMLMQDASVDNSKEKHQIILGLVNKEKIYKVGDFIGQLVFNETLSPEISYELFLDETQRGSGGFGHSDIKV